MDDKETLAKAVAGSEVVYGVTDYWATMDMNKEIQQGKNLADAVKDAKVGLLIYSTLMHISKRKPREPHSNLLELEKKKRPLTTLQSRPATYRTSTTLTARPSCPTTSARSASRPCTSCRAST